MEEYEYEVSCDAQRGRVIRIQNVDEIANGEMVAIKSFDTLLSSIVEKAKVKEHKYEVENQGGNSTVCYGVMKEG